MRPGAKEKGKANRVLPNKLFLGGMRDHGREKNMSRKCLCWLGIIPAVGLFVLAGFAWRLPSGISKRSYDRITPGMTEAEVEGVIGFPEGQHGPLKHYPVTTFMRTVGTKGIPWESWPASRSEADDTKRIKGKVKEWSGYGIRLAVAIDELGQVVGVLLCADEWRHLRQ